jgi:hypothetical protein
MVPRISRPHRSVSSPNQITGIDPVGPLPLARVRQRTHILGVVRFVVLTSIVLTVATATALAQPDSQCRLDDRSVDTVTGPADQDPSRRPGPAPLVATPATPAVFDHPVTSAVPIEVTAPADPPVTAAVIAFAPKTSPPRARWF